MALNDDFGYLRSVVLTLQHGRPWTDHWLEPWAASLSSLSAGLWLVTGRFHLATYGLLAALAGVSFFALGQLWRGRGFSVRLAVLPALLLLTFPALFWKEIEYTGVALHVPCLLLALLCAEQRRWGAFLIVWLVALANRQSAIAWLAIPALEFLMTFRTAPESPPRSWRPVLAVAVGGVLWFGLLSLVMNQTHAQTLITSHSFDHINWPRYRLTLAVGAGVFLLATGLGNFLLLLRGRFERPRWPWYWLQILVAAAGIKLLAIDLRSLVSFEHPGYDFGPVSAAGLKLLLGMAVVGWLRPGIALDFRKALYALAGLGLVALRSDLWDYYLVEVAILGLLCPRPADVPAGPGPLPSPAGPPIVRELALLAVLAGLCLQGQVLYRLKLQFIDHAAALCRVTEESVRSGRLQVSEIGHTNIGYMGWHLHPHFISHEGKLDANLVGFIRYLAPASVGLSVFPLARTEAAAEAHGRPNPADPAHLGTGVYPMAWVFHQRYTLSRTQPAPLPPIVAEDFRPWPFPLTDAEWSDLIARRGLWQAPTARP